MIRVGNALGYMERDETTDKHLSLPAIMFADTDELARGLAQVKLIVSYDLFMNETSRRFADLVLPATAWLEDIGLKQTATHIYLLEHALTPAGECRSLIMLLRELAQRLDIANVFPWQNEEEYVNAFLAAQKTETGEPLTVDILRRHGGYWQKNGLSHVAYQGTPRIPGWQAAYDAWVKETAE